MKQWISAISMFFVLATTSCVRHKTEGVNLNGQWIVTDVRLEGVNNPSNYKITMFDDVSSNCLPGSAWFLTESGNATYTITETSDCTGGARPINWSLQSSNGVQYVQIKHIDEAKARKVKEGYRLELSNVTKSGFTLREPTQIENNTAYVVLNFTKK